MKAPVSQGGLLLYPYFEKRGHDAGDACLWEEIYGAVSAIKIAHSLLASQR